ncbi:MAG TPA: GIY-YIG nuclease family protein [Longimicrobium sp.]|jgi:putative endonuclease
MKQYYVYILASLSRKLYIGVTSDLARRVYEHKHEVLPGFTAKYDIDRLVYFEVVENPRTAIARETQLKGLLRKKKVELIESANPGWRDLAVELGLID